METTYIYRKRIIPEECILLKDDVILYEDETRIITKWNSLTKKAILHHGVSCYFTDLGYKISKFYREDNSLIYWYCDIIKSDFDSATKSLTTTDLLADVIIEPSGFVKVVDLDELTDAFKQNLISSDDLSSALLSLNRLLQTIYAGEFESLCKLLNDIEANQ